MAVTNWLADKSALVRLGASSDAAEWAAWIQRGLVRSSAVTRLEVGYSARSARTCAPTWGGRTPAIEDRTVEVLTLLNAPTA